MEIEEIGVQNPFVFNGFKKEIPEEPACLNDDVELLKEDLWAFRYFWPEIVERFTTIEGLYGAIQELHDEIRTIKETYRSMALGFPDLTIEPNSEGGISGSYFLLDAEGKRRYFIKPNDEDAGCINNNGYATPYHKSPLRSNIPLYRSSMREVLASLFAEAIGVGSLVPKTVLGIFESEKFRDFSHTVSLSELPRYMEQCGPVDHEKLCSVQEYVSNAKSLFETVHELEMVGLTDDEIAARFDQTDFEEANILLWTIYDTDGHMGNFLVYPKGVDEIGGEILGLKKIDNGLAFPDKNRQLRNNLIYLPNAKRELSEEGKAKIAAIDVEVLADQMEKMGLESAIPALRERIPILQNLAKKPGITLKEINKAMTQIGKKQ